MGHIRDRMADDLVLAGRSESTRTSYLRCAKAFVKHFMRSPEELGEAEVRQHLLHLATERKLAVGTRLVYHGAIKFLFAVTLTRPEVVANVPWPRRKRRPPVVPTRDEVRQLLATAKAASPYWHAFLLTAYAAGLRRMEVVALRAEDIDSRAGLLRVRCGKGDKPRQVMLDPELLTALRAHYKQQGLPGPWLFPAPGSGGWSDRPISRSAATAAFRRLARQAGLREGLTLHKLRHAFATHLLDERLDLVTLQHLLGHCRIETTAQYCEVSTRRLQAVPSLLEKLRV